MSIPIREFTLKHDFTNVSEIGAGDNRESAPQMHFHVPWYIMIKHKNARLACYLSCGLNRNAWAWSIDTEFEIKAVSASDQFDSQKMQYMFHSECSAGYGYSDMVEWATMLANVLNYDKMTIEIQVKIIKMSGVSGSKNRDFGDPNIKNYDTIIEVGSEPFLIDRSLLINQSAVFNELLNKEDKPTAKNRKRPCLPPRIALEDVVPYHFQLFLEVLHCEPVISDISVDEILGVAVKFQTRNVIRMCEEFLNDKSKRTLKEKFGLIGKYKLESVMSKCLPLIETTGIRSVLSGNLESMGSFVLGGLLEKLLENLQDLEADSQKPSVKREFTMTRFISQASQMTKDEEFFGDVAEHFNLKWQLSITPSDEDIVFELLCNYVPLEQSEWSVYVDYNFQINSINGENMNEWGDYEFGSAYEASAVELNSMEWEDFESYLVDDSVSIEVYVEITKIEGIEKPKLMDFGESQKEMSDIIFVVGEERFYLSKRSLGQQSQYFKNLLFGPYKDKSSSEITVPDVEPKDFQNFLEVYFGKLYIDDSTIAGIWRLGDMYGAEDVIKRCEEFVIEKSELPLKDKLDLAVKCNSEWVKTKLLAGIETAADIQSVLSDEVEDMDASVLAVLLIKAINL